MDDQVTQHATLLMANGMPMEVTYKHNNMFATRLHRQQDANYDLNLWPIGVLHRSRRQVSWTLMDLRHQVPNYDLRMWVL